MTTQPQIPFKILLIGDNCTDVYRYGTVDRISPEAPVPVFKFSHEEERPGMAANVQANLEALGCEVYASLGTPGRKIRLIDQRSRQHLLRIDEDVETAPFNDPAIFENEFDAIVISDYNKGYITYELVEQLRRNFAGPIFIDTKKQDIARFKGCYVKINEKEFYDRWTDNDYLIVTLGGRGAMYRQYLTLDKFPAQPVEVVDVCGAGDTFLAALAYDYLINKDIPEAIRFAIRASAVTVQHTGVYAPKWEEIV